MNYDMQKHLNVEQNMRAVYIEIGYFHCKIKISVKSISFAFEEDRHDNNRRILEIIWFFLLSVK